MSENGHAIQARHWLHHHAVWSPDVIQDIQLKAELGRYRYRGMSTTRPVPNFDDLTFLPCTLSRVPLDGLLAARREKYRRAGSLPGRFPRVE